MSFIIKGSDIKHEIRGGEKSGEASIAWAIEDSSPHQLPCGFGTWHEAECVPKTLDYDEVILVLEGTFGIEVDGQKYTAQAGDVINLPMGTSLKYFGTNAKIFFVTTPTY